MILWTREMGKKKSAMAEARKGFTSLGILGVVPRLHQRKNSRKKGNLMSTKTQPKFKKTISCITQKGKIN